MRKSDYYIYNVLVVVWAITSICFFAFLFPIEACAGSTARHCRCPLSCMSYECHAYWNWASCSPPRRH